MEDEMDFGAVINHHATLIEAQNATINKQRCRIVELENEKHRFDLIYTEPVWFLLWFWRSRIWPFSILWGHQRVD
jgi:hypothetical protein